jgi:alkylated DNA repair dioxygenase AlkB
MSVSSEDLFGASPTWPQGLRYVEGFLSLDDEQRLLEELSHVPTTEAQYLQYTARRRVASFGKSYDFAQRRLLDAPPLPDFLIELRRRVAAWLQVPADHFAHALINEYRPGTPLGWHRDAMNFELVAGVSLASACRLRFRPYPHRRNARTFLLEVQPRSLYTMHGDARWKWQHSVSPTRSQRWSITFRTMRSSDIDPGASR